MSDPNTSYRWVERNSREIVPGDLFIAVKGERFDGHAFVDDAAHRGAAAALVSRGWADSLEGPPPLPLLVVDDPVTALQQVAAARRQSMPLNVIGVTGSIGKTSTKETIAAGLRRKMATYWSPGNMNSEIGLPLSILEIPEGTEAAVLEMGGAYAFGELALLAEIAQPAIGVVTNVFPVHLERMGSIEAIAETKFELVASLPASGTAVLNADNPYVRAMAARTRARVVTYGVSESCDLQATSIRTLGLDGIAFTLRSEHGDQEVRLPLVGAHAVELALAAIGAGIALGLEIGDVLEGIARSGTPVRLVPMPGPRGSKLLDDTYNASAPSVLSALRLLGEIPSRRRIAVLGDMRELGSEAAVQHREVGIAVAAVADVLITFGTLARMIAEAALEACAVDGKLLDVQSFELDQREDVTRLLLSELRSGDTALLKGSRGLEMETIVEALRAQAGTAGPNA
jgi:UDP-N-acetylmuramoyl-tripeptide--D-alanyl-D-alanine ligase